CDLSDTPSVRRKVGTELPQEEPENMTTMIRNLIKSPVVLPVRGGDPITFQPAGDIGGEDCIMVEDTVVKMPDFVAASKRGLLAEVPEEEIEALLDEQIARQDQGATQAARTSQDVIVPIKD